MDKSGICKKRRIVTMENDRVYSLHRETMDESISNLIDVREYKDMLNDKT